MLPAIAPVLDFLPKRTRVHLALLGHDVPPFEPYALPCEGLVEFGLYVGLKAYGAETSHLERDLDERTVLFAAQVFAKPSWADLMRRNFYCDDAGAVLERLARRGYAVVGVADLDLPTERYLLADVSKDPIEFLNVYACAPDMPSFGFFPHMRWTYDGAKYACCDVRGNLEKRPMNPLAVLIAETLVIMSVHVTSPVDMCVPSAMAIFKGLLEFRWGLDAPDEFFERVRVAIDRLSQLT